MTTRAGRALAAALTAVLAAAAVLLGSAGPASATVGQWTVRPFVDCVWTNSDGTRTVSMGYESYNAGTVTVPVGTDNHLDFGAADQGQPTTFQQGSHANVWALTMSNSSYLNGHWYLLSASMSFTMNGTACATKPVPWSAGSGTVGLAAAVLVGLGGTAALVRRRGAHGRALPG